MWPFRIDLGRVSYARSLEAVAPLLPGGVLVIGILSTWPEVFSRLFGTPPGYYVAIASTVLVAYAIGFVLMYLASALAYGVLGALSQFMAFEKGHRILAKNLQWRKVAAEFLGERLAPDTQAPFYEESFKLALKMAESESDEYERAKKVKEIWLKQLPLKQADFEWESWYDILQEYFAGVRTIIDESAHVVIIIIHSVGWSTVFLWIISPQLRHPLVIVVSLLAIVLGVILPVSIFYNYSKTDPLLLSQLTARILGELRKEKDTE